MNKKNGNTRSVKVHPCQSACKNGSNTWPQSPGLLTINIKARVMPLNTSSATNLLFSISRRAKIIEMYAKSFKFQTPVILLDSKIRRVSSKAKYFLATQSSNFKTSKNAFCGMSTLPIWRIFFFPSFCFSSSFLFLLISPP